MCNPSGKSLNWAGNVSCAMVVDALSSLAIFLVSNFEGGMGCHKKFRERGSIGNNGMVSPSERDIFNTKALGVPALFR